MKKKIALVLLCFAAVTVLWGHPSAQAEMAANEVPAAGEKAFTRQTDDDGGVLTYEDFIGKRFAVMTGSTYDSVADKVFKTSEKLYFSNNVETVEAVKLGKADAALLGDVIATLCLNSGPYDDLQTLPIPLEGLEFEYGVFSTRKEVIDQYNQFISPGNARKSFCSATPTM